MSGAGRGRPSAATSGERRSRAAAYIAQRMAAGDGPPSAADLGRELGIAARSALSILDELRAVDLAPPPVVTEGGRRRASVARGAGVTVRLSVDRLARLAELPGSGPLEQIDAALDMIDKIKKRST